MISMGTHVGTHVDALAHVSQDGKLYGDVDAGLRPGGRPVRRARRPHDRPDGASRPAARRARRTRGRAARARPGDHRRRPGDDPRAAGHRDPDRRRRAGPLGLGPALRLRRRRHLPRPVDRRPRRLRGRCHLPGRVRHPRHRRRHHRLRAARARRRPRTAARPPGAAGRGRHLHHRGPGPRGPRRRRRPRVPLRDVAAEVLRRHRLARPPARRGRADERLHAGRPTPGRQATRPASRRRSHAGPAARPRSPRTPRRHGVPPRPWPPRSVSARSTSSDSAWPPTGCPRRPPPSTTCSTRAATRSPRGGRAHPGLRRAGCVRQRRARALPGLRRHPPALGAAPQRLGGPRRARRRRARRRPGRGGGPRDRGRHRGGGPARHGRLRRRPGQLRLLRARPARHLDHRRDGLRGRRGDGLRAGRAAGSPTPSGSPPRWRPA